MIKKKTMVLLCFLWCLQTGIHADTGKSLVIQKNNGSKTTFLLSESPELTFSNRSLKVTVNGKNTTFQIDDVAQYYFEIVSNPTPTTFTYKTEQGITLNMQETEGSSKTAQVGSDGERAVASNVSGMLVVPESANGKYITGIGENAFKGCYNLTAIVLPSTIINIGSNAFNGCTGLKYILLREKNVVNKVGSNLAYNNSKPTTIPIYVRKNVLLRFQSHDEWKKYNLIGYTPGDADNDDVIDVVDIQQDVNYILERPSTGFNVGGGDADEDNVIDVNDIQTIINKILGISNARMLTNSEEKTIDSGMLRLEQLTNNELSLKLNSGNRYSAFQFKLHLPQYVQLSSIKLNEGLQESHKMGYVRLSDGSYQVVGYSDNGTALTGEQVLSIQLNGSSGEVYADDICFSTVDAQKVRFDRLSAGMTSMEATKLTEQNVSISYSDNDVIHIGGVTPQSSVRLFAADGKDYSMHVSVYDDHAIISLASLSKGVYIIRVNNQQIKMIRK